jgi:hypothetical protein
MNLQEVGCEGIDWIDLAQDRDSGRQCKCAVESSGSMKCGKLFDWV